MRYTQKQELLVSRYLREVGEELEELPYTTRERVLLRLKARIAREFDALGQGTPGDEEIQAVLRRFGAPSEMAREILSKHQPAGQLALASPDRRWLGVCLGIAERLDLSVGLVRAVFLALGLTGPAILAFCLGRCAAAFAAALLGGAEGGVAWQGVPGAAIVLSLGGPVVLIVYLALYFEMYLTSDPEEVPRISRSKVATLVLGTLGGASALYAGTRGVLALITYAYVRFTGKSTPFLGKWGWLEANAGSLFLALLCALLPMALLCSLPVPNRWDNTGKRIVQAGLATYALVLCLGIASTLVGIIFVVVEEFTE